MNGIFLDKLAAIGPSSSSRKGDGDAPKGNFDALVDKARPNGGTSPSQDKTPEERAVDDGTVRDEPTEGLSNSEVEAEGHTAVEAGEEADVDPAARPPEGVASVLEEPVAASEAPRLSHAGDTPSDGKITAEARVEADPQHPDLAQGEMEWLPSENGSVEAIQTPDTIANLTMASGDTPDLQKPRVERTGLPGTLGRIAGALAKKAIAPTARAMSAETAEQAIVARTDVDLDEVEAEASPISRRSLGVLAHLMGENAEKSARSTAPVSEIPREAPRVVASDIRAASAKEPAVDDLVAASSERSAEPEGAGEAFKAIKQMLGRARQDTAPSGEAGNQTPAGKEAPVSVKSGLRQTAAAMPMESVISKVAGQEFVEGQKLSLEPSGELHRTGAASVDAGVSKPDAPPAPRSPIVQNVMQQVQGAKMDPGSLKIQLRPHGLGIVELEIVKAQDGSLEISMRAKNPMVLDALRAERHVISEMLSQQGVQLRGDGLSFDSFGQGGAKDREAEKQGGASVSDGEDAAEETIEDPVAITAEHGDGRTNIVI